MSDSNQNPSKWKRGLATVGAGLAATTGAVAATPKQYNVPVSNSVPAIHEQVVLPRQPMDYVRDLSENLQSGGSRWAELKKRSGQIKQSAKVETLSANTPKTSQNKGIEAARQKASANQSKNSSQPTNQGIKSFQSKVSGQSSGASKSSASGGQSKGSGQGR